MNKNLLLASAAALALCVGVSAPAVAASGKSPAVAAKMTHSRAHFKGVNRAAGVLYDQNDDSQGYADISQNFESSFDAYDAQGADDFTVPAGSKWSITEVDVTGLYFNGPGLANSENVSFYKVNKKGKFGKKPKSSGTYEGTDDGIGDFAITLSNGKSKKGVSLKSGHYAVSVQANMDFSVGGEWGWATRNTQAGNPAQWQNPGDGFATGCTKWSDEAPCLGGTAGPDHMFTLRGTSK
jgi:hypothetical protein